MRTPRRDFLTWLGAGSALTALAPLAPLGAQEPAQKPVNDKWDMTWVDRIRGTPRAVFDSPGLSEGAGVFRAVLWQQQQHEVYGNDPSAIATVIVLRHEAIPLVMNDAYWARFEVGKAAKLRTPAGKKWAVANPVGSAPADAKGPGAAYNIPAFIASGGIVLACNLAFGEIVAGYREKDKLDATEGRKQAIANLIPGVILQPSGAFAVLRAQQAGCAYMMAS